MNGLISPDAPFAFFVEDFEAPERALYIGLLARFFGTGFEDPTLAGLAALSANERCQLELEHRNAFAPI